MRVMVTGSRGFLGRAVVAELESANHKVTRFDIEDGENILNSGQVERGMIGVDLCIHLAAVADLYDAEENVDKCRLVNVEGTRIVADSCHKNRVRLLFISTVCAYGNNGYDVQNENAPLMPTEIYAETKAEAEALLSSTDGLDYRIIRAATFYGLGMRDTLAVQRFINASKNGRRIEIHGSGQQTRCYTHVDDVAAAITIVAEQWPVELVYNVANPEPTSVIELVETIRSLSSVELEVIHVPDRNGQIMSSSIDVARMKSIGWSPEIELKEGIAQLL
jgi:UDP-glucose 4-epimerase